AVAENALLRLARAAALAPALARARFSKAQRESSRSLATRRVSRTRSRARLAPGTSARIRSGEAPRSLRAPLGDDRRRRALRAQPIRAQPIAARKSLHSRARLRALSRGRKRFMTAQRPRALSGIKPNGVPHIGNYLGMIRPAIALQETH